MKTTQKALKPLITTVNHVTSRTMGRALIALLVLALCETVCLSLLAAPLYVRVVTGAVGAETRVLAWVVLFASFVVWALFQYGFAVLLLRMVRGNYVTLGYIFWGWRTWRRALPVALFLAVVCTALTAAFITTLFCTTDVPARLLAAQEVVRTLTAEEAAGMTAQPLAGTAATVRIDVRGCVVLVAFAFITLTALLQLTFLFHATYDGETSSLRAALKTNWRLLSRRRLFLVRFVLAAGGRRLLIAALALFLSLLIPATPEQGSGGGVLSMTTLLFNIVYLINGYTALLRMYIAVPVLYEEARKPQLDMTIGDDTNHSEKDRAVISETIAFLEHDDATAGGVSTPSRKADSANDECAE